MNQWLYKVTPTKVPFGPTHDLAVHDGFICKAAYEQGGARADHTKDVDFGDVLHVYFVDGADVTTIGSFDVVEAQQHPNPVWFGPQVPGTRLWEVGDPSFAQRLQSLPLGNHGTGYGPDPKLGKMIGWAVRQSTTPTPPYVSSKFPAQHTFVKC